MGHTENMMDRRKLLKLAGMAAMAPVLPRWAEAEFRGEIPLAQGIQVVRPWVLKQPKLCNDPYHKHYGPLQIFRTNSSYAETMTSPKSAGARRKLYLHLLNDHIDTIAAHIIMSSEFDDMVVPEGAGPDEAVPVRTLRGFRSRFGRMPLPGDEGRLLVLGNDSGDSRYLRVRCWYDPLWDAERLSIITECSFFMEHLT